MKFILLCTTAVFVMGCSVQVKPVCNREAQTWDKFNTVEDICFVPPVKVVVNDRDGGKNTPINDHPNVEPDHPDDLDHNDSPDNVSHDYNGDHSGSSDSNDSNEHNDDH